MNVIKELRKKLGPYKQVLVDEWPYKSRVKAIPESRAKCRHLLEELEPLPAFRENLYEIHMLCGKRDIDMGIWASWSMMRFLEGNSRLYVHSDGTLTDEDMSVWKKIVGEVVLVERALSDRTVEEALGSCTRHLYRWRCSNWASAQLVDVHFFGEAPNLLIMDSDVLTFSRPTEVLDALVAPQPQFRWCRDLRNAYSADPAVLAEITGVQLPERLCAGFLVSPRLGKSDFMELDRHLESIDKDPRVDVGHFWSCQTYYGLMAAARSHSEILPDTYSNTAGKTGESQVLRHYVGIPRVRFRYFTEGIPRVMQRD